LHTIFTKLKGDINKKNLFYWDTRFVWLSRVVIRIYNMGNIVLVFVFFARFRVPSSSYAIRTSNQTHWYYQAFMMFIVKTADHVPVVNNIIIVFVFTWLFVKSLCDIAGLFFKEWQGLTVSFTNLRTNVKKSVFYHICMNMMQEIQTSSMFKSVTYLLCKSAHGFLIKTVYGYNLT
jgi:hypothetical protein